MRSEFFLSNKSAAQLKSLATQSPVPLTGTVVTEGATDIEIWNYIERLALEQLERAGDWRDLQSRFRSVFSTLDDEYDTEICERLTHDEIRRCSFKIANVYSVTVEGRQNLYASGVDEDEGGITQLMATLTRDRAQLDARLSVISYSHLVSRLVTDPVQGILASSPLLLAAEPDIDSLLKWLGRVVSRAASENAHETMKSLRRWMLVEEVARG